LKIFGVLLGVFTAVGGFIEIGDLVFLGQAGSVFGYDTLWAIVLGLIGIMVYAEMAGRVAAVSHRPVFDLIRERLGFGFGATTLLAGQVVTLLTLAAEIGGVALVLQLLFDLPAQLLIGVVGILFLFLIWVMSFEMIERVFSLMGLGLLIFIVAALKTHPDWSGVGQGAIPNWDTSEIALYGYFAVGIIAAMFMPYEIYFYSSGGIEEGWNRSDARLNKGTVLLGFTLGGVLSAAILMSSAQVLKPNGIQPDLLGTVALTVQSPLGEAGLLIALIGMLFAIGGATAETALSGAYNVAQFFGWEWGKYKKPRGAPRFTVTWMTMIVIGTLIIITGIDPVQVTEFAVIFSVVALPLSYLPVLLVANDRTYMEDEVNGPFANVLGWFYLVVIVIAALAAIPLMIMTNMGKG
jgi:manganese transport protein